MHDKKCDQNTKYAQNVDNIIFEYHSKTKFHKYNKFIVIIEQQVLWNISEVWLNLKGIIKQFAEANQDCCNLLLLLIYY